jgi:drug/metabolite transporter (DMT)-like permease
VAVVRRRRQPVSTWGGIALTVLGLSLIAQPWDGFVFDALGVTAALIAAVALAAYFLLADAAGPSVPPLELCAWAATAAAVLLAVIQPWWTFPFAALGRPAAFGNHHVAVWLVLIVVVGVGTVIAYLTGIAALALLPTSVAAVLATLEIVVASVFAWLALDEHLSVIEIVGALVLMTGATLAQRGRAGAEPVAAPASVAADVTP